MAFTKVAVYEPPFIVDDGIPPMGKARAQAPLLTDCFTGLEGRGKLGLLNDTNDTNTTLRDSCHSVVPVVRGSAVSMP